MPSRDGHIVADDGVRLYFERLGDDVRPVVVPNGLYLRDDFARLARARSLVVYDLRNRGRSDTVTDPAGLARGIHNDVDDLESVRRHFGIDRLTLVGHSYVGLTVLLYAIKHPTRVERIVQIGPSAPSQATVYPPHLTAADDTLRDVLAALAAIQGERSSMDPQAFCEKAWSILRAIYVANPADAGKIRWGRCELPNERALMKYWTERILPSMRELDITDDDLAAVDAPVLTVHGRQDRSAPYGGGREWALRLPNARLLTVDNAGHAPWIEAPDLVLDSIEVFLSGVWPAAAEKIEAL